MASKTYEFAKSKLKERFNKVKNPDDPYSINEYMSEKIPFMRRISENRQQPDAELPPVVKTAREVFEEGLSGRLASIGDQQEKDARHISHFSRVTAMADHADQVSKKPGFNAEPDYVPKIP